MSSVIRLIFGHSDDGVSLISRERVEMTLPAEIPVDDDALPDAFVAEVRGSDDRVLHRTAIPNPLDSHREVFSEEPDRSISRVSAEQPEGAFAVIVPDTPEADHLALLTAGPTRDDAGSAIGTLEAGGRREIARFSLTDSETEGEPE